MTYQSEGTSTIDTNTTPSQETPLSEDDFSWLSQILEKEEGYRAFLYDDATGKTIKKGSTLIGNPTIGIGWNTAGKSLSLDRARVILSWFIQDSYQELKEELPWVLKHPKKIQLALLDLCFNLGISKLLKFKQTLSLIESGKYKEAADNLDTTLWAKQVGARANNIEELISK